MTLRRALTPTLVGFALIALCTVFAVAPTVANAAPVGEAVASEAGTTEAATTEAAAKGGGSSWITDHVYDGPHLDLFHALGIDVHLPREAGITKHTIFVLLAALITFLILWGCAKNLDRVPRGMRLAIEEIVRYFREDFIYPNMGVDNGRKFTPFLLTLFLFILVMNLLGMIPFGAAATSNVYVTGTLAVIVFACMLIGGMLVQGPIKFWINLVPHGVPALVWPMLFLIELMGLVIKPFALMVRLAANMTAGHIVIFSIMSFIFFFKNWLIAPFPVVVIVLFSLLELLVAFIQAYVFTMLSAVFIGMSLDPEH